MTKGTPSTINGVPHGRLEECVLHNGRGDRVRLLNYGARIHSIQLETRGGTREVVYGYASLADYLSDAYYVGATLGRVGNRIRGSSFRIGSEPFQLAANEGPHHLHGGPGGFDKKYWSIAPGATTNRAEFTLRSGDGDQGYPGRLDVRVAYSWDDERELRIEYTAITDRATHVNLVSHPYFNLDGRTGDVLDHRVSIDADSVTVVDAEALPTGELRSLAGSSLDLRTPRTVRAMVESADPLVTRGGGIDLNYVLNGDRVAARLWGGRRDLAMEIETSYPGLQFYTGHHLAAPLRRFGGACLEPQYFPDAANQPSFAPTLLETGQRYVETVLYRFVGKP